MTFPICARQGRARFPVVGVLSPEFCTRGSFRISTLAPICLFVFNRPDHTRSTLAALTACRGFDASLVHVFSDGPRGPTDRDKVDAVRAVVREMLGPAAAFRFSEHNRGLADSIIGGVTELVEAHGRVVVVEDDLEVSPEFLIFVNSALDRYVDDERVMQVSGHIYPVPEFIGRPEAMFFPLTTTWGWGTWKRAWDHFDPEARGWQDLAQNRSLRTRFDLEGAYPYSTLLESQMKSGANSWGIRWYWSVFKKGGIACFPPESLVRNTGMDGSGVHGRGLLNRFRFANEQLANRPVALPGEPQVDDASWTVLKNRMRELNRPFLSTPRRLLQSLLRRG